MTKFERDLQDALNGNEIEILKRRKAEIEKLTAEFNNWKSSLTLKNKGGLSLTITNCYYQLKDS